MGTGVAPEIAVKIGASTSGLTEGFAQAVRTTEQGVAQMNASLSKLEQSQVNAEMWTRRRAAAERDAYAISTRMAAVQTTVASSVRTVTAATAISGTQMASAANKAVIFTNALSAAGTVNGSVAAKFLMLGTTVQNLLGPAGVAALAVGGFATLVMTKMRTVRAELEETARKWTDTINDMINAGDIAGLMKELREVQQGTRAADYQDGIDAARRRVTALKEEVRLLYERGAIFQAAVAQDKLEDEQAALDKLLAKYAELAGRIRNIANAPRVYPTGAVITTADAPGRKDPDEARAFKDAEALARAHYQYQQALAGEDVERRRRLMYDWLARTEEVYGRNSVEYLGMLTEIERFDTEHAARQEANFVDQAERWAEMQREITAINEDVTAAYAERWEATLDRVHALFERSFEGFFALNDTLAESFRKLGVNILGAMVTAAIESAKAWLVSTLVTQKMGEQTARKTVVNSAVEAAARAWAATVGIPVVGPILAPVAAAASFTGVLAFGGSIASAAGGWDNVPADQLAMVHKSEMILPAPLAESIRAMAGGGGRSGGGTLHVSAIDAQSFEAALRRNDSTLVRVIEDLFRNGQLRLA